MSEQAIDFTKYEAKRIAGTHTWMVKRLERGTDFSNQANYVEAEIEVDTNDPYIAVRAAVARNSWA